MPEASDSTIDPKLRIRSRAVLEFRCQCKLNPSREFAATGGTIGPPAHLSHKERDAARATWIRFEGFHANQNPGTAAVILGRRELFTQAHYEANKGVAPAHLCELVVHCLELVSQLSHHGLRYRFKGGNSLLLLLEDPQRFSIDVDIVTKETKQAMIAAVEEVTAACDVFQRFESRAPQTKPWLPMISFKLYFDSCYQPADEAFVMLDVVLEPPPYPGVLRQVRCGALYASSVEAEVPSVSGLIGDKLLTIGPSTLGIPLGKGKAAQRLKHVFDVSLLVQQGYDLEQVHRAIRGCQQQEERIQRSSYFWKEIAADTLRFCSEPLAHEQPPDPRTLGEATYLYEIVTGFDGFREHLFRTDYTWKMLQADCRRVVDLVEELGGATG